MKKILIALICSAVAMVTPQILYTQQTTQAQALKLPVFKKQKTPDAVVDEHLDAINKCDWARIMAQYPADAQIFLPLGQTIQGRDKIGDLFAAIVKTPDQGGICGVKFSREHTFSVGRTVSVQWIITADFLAEPYRGSDAYITKNGLMAAMVTTFQGAQLKYKVAGTAK